MTDTYNGKPIAEMTREELEKALLKALAELERQRNKYNRMVRMLTGCSYGGGVWH